MANLADLMQSFFNKGAAAANILSGFQSAVVTTGVVTLISIPAGRTWSGKIGASVSCHNAAAALTVAQAKVVFTTQGAGVTPAAGSIFAVNALAGANAATGTVGDAASANNQVDVIVVAPSGNAVNIQTTVTIAGTGGETDAWAIGQLI